VPEPRNVSAVLSSVTEHWSPRTIAVVNDYDVRVVKLHGESTRHAHPETDEFFLVLTAVLLFEPSVTVNTGDTPSHLTAERRPL